MPNSVFSVIGIYVLYSHKSYPARKGIRLLFFVVHYVYTLSIKIKQSLFRCSIYYKKNIILHSLMSSHFFVVDKNILIKLYF